MKLKKKFSRGVCDYCRLMPEGELDARCLHPAWYTPLETVIITEALANGEQLTPVQIQQRAIEQTA